MPQIEDSIKKIISELGNEFKILSYVYNGQEEFIPGKTPVYYSGPYWDEREIVAAVTALLTGKWLSSGENVYQFENKFAQKVNNKYAVMVNSGSSANLVMIAALKKFFGWQDGSEIIVSVVGFPTTISAIIQNNLQPVFVDIEMDTLNFDIFEITKKINPKTKAIFVSPVLGNPPDFDYLVGLCKSYDIELILDNCDSLGTTWSGKHLNEYAVASSYSFYPAHHITTGEGGMITSDSEEIIKIARSISWWGRDCYCVGPANLLKNGTCQKRFDCWLKPQYDGVVDHKYVFSNVGYNLKPLDLQGAIGLVQLKKLEEIHQNRIYSHDIITNIFFRELPALQTPSVHGKAVVSWFGTPFICPTKEYKNKLVSHLEEGLVQTRNYFSGNILLQPAYKYLDDYKEYPQANKVLDTVFFIGASPHYTDQVFEYIKRIAFLFRMKND